MEYDEAYNKTDGQEDIKVSYYVIFTHLKWMRICSQKVSPPRQSGIRHEIRKNFDFVIVQKLKKVRRNEDEEINYFSSNSSSISR